MFIILHDALCRAVVFTTSLLISKPQSILTSTADGFASPTEGVPEGSHLEADLELVTIMKARLCL